MYLKCYTQNKLMLCCSRAFLSSTAHVYLPPTPHLLPSFAHLHGYVLLPIRYPSSSFAAKISMLEESKFLQIIFLPPVSSQASIRKTSQVPECTEEIKVSLSDPMRLAYLCMAYLHTCTFFFVNKGRIYFMSMNGGKN